MPAERGQGGKKRAAKKPAGVAGAQPNRQRPAQKGPRRSRPQALRGEGQARGQPDGAALRRGSPRRGPLAAPPSRSSRRRRDRRRRSPPAAAPTCGPAAPTAPTWQSTAGSSVQGSGGCGERRRPEDRRLSSKPAKAACSPSAGRGCAPSSAEGNRAPSSADRWSHVLGGRAGIVRATRGRPGA